MLRYKYGRDYSRNTVYRDKWRENLWHFGSSVVVKVSIPDDPRLQPVKERNNRAPHNIITSSEALGQ